MISPTFPPIADGADLIRLEILNIEENPLSDRSIGVLYPANWGEGNHSSLLRFIKIGKRMLVIGMSSDKDYPAVAGELAPLFDRGYRHTLAPSARPGG